MTDPHVDALVTTSFEVSGIIAQVAKRHGVPVGLVRVGGILRDRTPPMSDLAEYLGLDRSTITGIVDSGERLGYLRRIEDQQDGRSTRVELTQAGHALARACEKEVAQSVGPLLADLKRRL